MCVILPEQLSLSMSVVHKIKTKEVGLVEKEGWQSELRVVGQWQWGGGRWGGHTKKLNSFVARLGGGLELIIISTSSINRHIKRFHPHT